VWYHVLVGYIKSLPWCTEVMCGVHKISPMIIGVVLCGSMLNHKGSPM